MLFTFRALFTFRRPHCHTLFRPYHGKHGRAVGYLRRSTSGSDTEQLEKLLGSLKRFKAIKSDAPFEPFIHMQLSRHLRSMSEPYALYSKTISWLVENRFFLEATTVHERMVGEGFIPPAETQAEMVAVALALSDTDADIDRSLREIVAHPDFSEKQLMNILELMVDLGVGRGHVIRVARQFVESRDEGFSPSERLVTKVVDAQVRAGNVEDAFETIIQYEADTPTPYTAVLAALKEVDPSNRASLRNLFSLMEQRGVQLDISVFNGLLSLELRRRRFSYMFKLYTLLKTKLSDGLTPNASTYATMFGAVAKLSPFRERTLIRKRPKNTTPLRQLYGDMMFFHATKALKTSSRSMNLALYAFLVNRDYAGAFVVLRSFSLFGIPITPKTYDIVMTHIVDRICHTRRRPRARGRRYKHKVSRRPARKHQVIRARNRRRHPGFPSWGNRFFGGGWPIGLSPDDGIKLTEYILSAVTRPVFDALTPFLPDEQAVRHYKAPTPDMMARGAEGRQTTKFDVLPLLRVLRRAILSQKNLRMDKVSAQHISKSISRAKREMNVVKPQRL